MVATEVLQLPLRERLHIMEVIWADLRERADSFEISQDQKDLFDSRRAAVADGVSKIHDWDRVKHLIGQA